MSFLSFVVPNFQNEVPTLIVIDQIKFDSSDQAAQKLNKSISKIKQRIPDVTDRDIKIYSKNSEFYIEIITNEKDITNRPATIGIHGKIPASFLNFGVEDWTFEPWIFKINQKIQELSDQVTRPIEKKHLDTVLTGVWTIWKRNKRRNLIIYLGKVAIAVITPIVVVLIWLKFLSSNNQLILIGCLISISNTIILLLAGGIDQ
ncbi:hypothetical protein [Dolichospermum circinale]|jgi:hypothetical protein|uniref:hypothetical protein n=1 Tax=Dolichospermum circinale TaxID=109265 RepID=UPI001BCA8BB6|nr:hypothetical protein [Dolichospermum circinale]MBS9387373.1 hypothetical protein [Dolichospermum sp. WA123]MDB9448746.1 hypothetical protein [Dolichospermum circinale CS-547]